jgi:hypothetical protein
MPGPVHPTIGNHDDPAALGAEFRGTSFLGGGASAAYAFEYPEATIIVADSRLEGSSAGLRTPGSSYESADS